ncbi:alpha/beta hydrolase [Sphingomonas piscis]|uniref:Alpha/beta hydrolase n=1 Tax=Sphingomonas piscis TaxID=2714943 RepID=A0A6G7YSI4_9SPHN|nr:alpha/beta hydrolase [Sphingomonas piscis]QIK79700.1 alpha/beta hydrolase [Sphingomonas piscis]
MTAAKVQHWNASDGVELAFHEVGEGAPVILLHGLFSSAEVNWIKFGHAARIAEQGFRVIMPDLRAHGLSGKPHDPGAYPKNILVRDLHELIARLDLTEYLLGGFSLGARTVLEAVVGGMMPERAVLAGIGSDVLTNWSRRSGFFLEAIRRFNEVERGDPHWLSVQFMKTMKIDRVAATQLLGSMVDYDSSDAVAAAFTMPTLVVCGSEDDENGSAEDLARLIGAQFTEIPGTHMSSVTSPELGMAIAHFLAS